MKKTGLYLMVTGVLMISAASFIFPNSGSLKTTESRSPAFTLNGTTYSVWKLVAGTQVFAIGLVFSLKKNVHQSSRIL